MSDPVIAYPLLQQALDQISKTHILVVGDLMLDRYVYGDVKRISPEAPIPVLKIKSKAASLGGAGNVARNLRALGCKIDLVGIVGKDDAAAEITSLVSANEGKGKITPHFIDSDHINTIVKTRYLSNRQQILRCDTEDDPPFDARITQKMLARALDLIETGGVQLVILSDYLKGHLPPDSIQQIIAMAKKMGKRVIIDPKGKDYERYRGADYITPNRKELSLASGISCYEDETIQTAARNLMEEYDIECVIATRSEQGMSIIKRAARDPLIHMPARARAVFDVAGAGDTVIATIAAGLGAKLDIKQAAAIANLAAGIVVAKVGTSIATPDELVAAIKQQAPMAEDSKIQNLKDASLTLETIRMAGKQIGFTNGCFDLLHPGHVGLLQQAKQHCDFLVVGLNSDQSVKRLKGETRPIQDQTSRAKVLAALGAVDMVVIFDEDTPLTLIETLKPDRLIKGADYKIDAVIGAKQVESWGGKVILADFLDGHSTTNLITKS